MVERDSSRLPLEVKRIRKVKNIVGSVVVAIAIALVAPIPILLLTEPEVTTVASWSSLYQIVSTVIATLALIAVVFTLWQQNLQANIARRVAVRSGHIDVMSIAMSEPETYMECFGLEDTEENRKRFKRQVFTTIHLRRTLDLYRLGSTKECTIRNEVCAGLFAMQFGRSYWRSTRQLWADQEQGDRVGENFVRILDEEHHAAELRTADAATNARVAQP